MTERRSPRSSIAFPQVVVIGIDGMPWRLLDRLIADGVTPTLAGLKNSGAYAPLRSTIRPESSVAWSSFLTGVNPGRHGVFGFVRSKVGTYDVELNTAASIGAPGFWEHLNSAGKRCILVNVPFTFPAKPMNGAIVTGMLTPSLNSSFIYPDTLRAKFLRQFPDYIIDVGPPLRSADKFIAHCTRASEQRAEAAAFLASEVAWDVLTVVFSAPDRLMHFFWKDIDPKHPRHDPQRSPSIKSKVEAYFSALDKAVKEVLDLAQPGALTIVMSDHGFNGFCNTIDLNSWLLQEGYLRLRRRTLKSHLSAGLLALNRSKTAKRAKRAIPGIRKLQVKPDLLRATALSGLADWGKTRAYYSLEGGIRLNLRGREPYGAVVVGSEAEALRKEIIERLSTARFGPEKLPLVAKVFNREEIYRGSFVEGAPDLIPLSVADSEDPRLNTTFGIEPKLGKSYVVRENPWTGAHDMFGIFIASGQGVSPGSLPQNPSIIDLAPTIYRALGVEIPQTMDGSPIQSLFPANG